jgi:quinol monooxygenase YgiN
MRSARAEKGLITCHLYQEADNPYAICYEEQWEARKDLEDQVRSTRYTRLLTLMESAAEQPTLDFHFVSETRGLDYIEGIRGAA